MKSATKAKDKTSEPLEQRFNRFAKALMAVPKKELDKELAKHESKKHTHNSRREHIRKKVNK